MNLAHILTSPLGTGDSYFAYVPYVLPKLGLALRCHGSLVCPSAGEVPGLGNLGKSYLSLDTDGRVVRLDSFAKFLAPGFRLGWLTAAPAFVDKLTFHMHGTALGPCSTTQVL